MHIVHLIDYFQPNIGYQETFLAREHAALGHDVTVVTSDRYFPFPDYEKTFSHILGPRFVGTGKRTEDGITVLRLPSWEIPGSPLVWLRGLRAAVESLHPDVILCHGVYSLTSYLIAVINRRTPFRLYYDTHAAAFNTPLTNTVGKKLYFSFYQTICAPTIRSAQKGIFAVGDEEQKFLRNGIRLVDKDVPIIRLGVDTKRFHFSATNRRRIRKELGISDEEIVIVSAGKMGPEKDIPILLRAFGLLKIKHIRLLLIGGGEGYDIVETQSRVPSGIPVSLREKIIQIPYVQNAELPAYFSAADIGVWPGNYTMTILEAMACSLPVVLAKQPSTRYLEASDGVQWFYRGDEQQLSESLKLLATASEKREIMGKNAQKYMEQMVSWPRIAKETIAFFQ